jgi:hypothetical protein
VREGQQSRYGLDVASILLGDRAVVVRVLLRKIPSHAFGGENGGQSGSSRSKEDGTMLAHRLRTIAFAAIAMGLATVASTQANVESSRTQYLTFTRPVTLPGVTLKSGTYIFELADADAAPDVVRVLSRDRKTVFLTAFTASIDRPASVPLSQYVSLREVGPDQAAPISVWWSEPRIGRQFVYTE